MATEDELKRAAAERALELVRPGMLVGLGTGTTARHFIAGVGRLVADGMQVSCLATSRASETQARALGIPLVAELDRPIDLAVDGADEVDSELRLIKGRGGAFFREKLVAEASSRFVVVAEESKLVPRLGAGVLPQRPRGARSCRRCRRPPRFPCQGQAPPAAGSCQESAG